MYYFCNKCLINKKEPKSVLCSDCKMTQPERIMLFKQCIECIELYEDPYHKCIHTCHPVNRRGPYKKKIKLDEPDKIKKPRKPKRKPGPKPKPKPAPPDPIFKLEIVSGWG